MAYSSEVLADVPLAYWRMNDASGLIQDSSGNGRHATAVSGTPVYQQSSPITSDVNAKSIRFDQASAEFFTFDPGGVTPLITNTFTLEAWVKRQGTGNQGEMGLLVNRSHGGGMYIQPDDTLMIAKSEVALIAASTVGISDLNWHHCVVTKNGATSKIYIDSVDRTGSVSDATCDGDVKIEIASEGPTYTSFDGYMAEAAVYGTALSQTRVSVHYAAATETDQGGSPSISAFGWLG